MTSLTPSSGQADRACVANSEPSADILARMERLYPEVINLALDRVERLLEALGRPQDKLPGVVHVAGTNGKGSVIAFLKAILEAAGERVHVFTSPHLVRFHERIALAGAHGAEQIGEQTLSDYLRRVEAANGAEPITFFEITTAAAFLAFAEIPADYVLLETGLGGRLDATNVIEKPALTLITPISRDHDRYLGSELGQIAHEKAGILKPGVPCVIARQESAALEVIEARAKKLGAPLLAHGEAWDAYEQHGRLIFQTGSGLRDLPLPRLLGRHQIDNAGAALAAIDALAGDSIADAALAAGLKAACWPARLQNLTGSALQAHVGNGTQIWLDGGHNVSAAQALAHAMAEMEERAPQPLHLICGMMTGKDAAGFFRQFKGLAEWAATIP
ncbi:MAG: bifunctional folylpolyglutamate synthase/dihydrofolate synthase, partial [Proteobacteria bacterium]|nr:bifunctional folylpolyglutamate synthase/dihydrofolate synthase [Pseudomonadota bacterium]